MISLVDDRAKLLELYNRGAAHHQPLSGVFELTNRCNLSCRMCYVNQPAGSRLVEQELSASKWLSLAHEAVDNGMVFLLLTGGEVFLRPDFFDIYEPLTRLGVVLSIFSNATLITDSIAKRLGEAPPSSTEITLYGATATTYEAITGVKGSYARCCDGIEALLENKIPLGLKTTITKQNVGELEAMRSMAQNWGISFYSGWLLSDRRDSGCSDVENCRLSISDSIEFEKKNTAQTSVTENEFIQNQHNDNTVNFYCLAGKSSFVITPMGEMNVCVDLPLPAVRPLEIGFKTAWEKVHKFVVSAPPPSTDCLACNIKDYCPRCPAWSWLENNTLTDPVPYLCNLAQMRQEKSI